MDASRRRGVCAQSYPARTGGECTSCAPRPLYSSGIFDLADLKAFPPTTQNVTYQPGSGTTSGTVTGVPLYDFLTSPQGGGGLVLDYSLVTPRPYRFFLGEIHRALPWAPSSKFSQALAICMGIFSPAHGWLSACLSSVPTMASERAVGAFRDLAKSLAVTEEETMAQLIRLVNQ